MKKETYHTLKRIYVTKLVDEAIIYNIYDRHYHDSFLEDIKKCNIEVIKNFDYEYNYSNDSIYIIYLYNQDNNGEYIIDYFYPYSLNKSRSGLITEVRVARLDFKSLLILSKYKDGFAKDERLLSGMNPYRHDNKRTSHKYEVKKVLLENINKEIRNEFNNKMERYQMENYNGICLTKAIKVNNINLLSDVKNTIANI
jgi:hypothetical protein